MIWVDYCILAVTLTSVVVGALRGFAKEIFSLLTWVLAIGLAWLFGDMIAGILRDSISIPAVRTVAGYSVCFFGGLLIGAVASMLLVEGIRNSRLSSVDRTMGAGFGLVRALVLVALFSMIASNMGAESERWWKRSALIGKIQWLANGLQVLVPGPVLEAIRPQAPAEPEPTAAKPADPAQQPSQPAPAQ